MKQPKSKSESTTPKQPDAKALGAVPGSISVDTEELKLMRKIVETVSDIKMAEGNAGFCEHAGGMELLKRDFDNAWTAYDEWNTE